MPTREETKKKYLNDGNVIFTANATYVDPLTGRKGAFRVGQRLPEDWIYEVDDDGRPVRSGCMALTDEGKKQIRMNQFAALGINVKSEKAKAKASADRKKTAQRSLDLDFLYLTDGDAKKLRKAQLVSEIARQFKLDAKNLEKMSVEDLLEIGRDAALDEQDKNK